MHSHPESDADSGAASDTASIISDVTTPTTPVDIEMAQLEEKTISEKIRNVQEKK